MIKVLLTIVTVNILFDKLKTNYKERCYLTLLNNILFILFTLFFQYSYFCLLDKYRNKKNNLFLTDIVFKQQAHTVFDQEKHIRVNVDKSSLGIYLQKSLLLENGPVHSMTLR